MLSISARDSIAVCDIVGFSFSGIGPIGPIGPIIYQC
jgi:hypothetical protein